MAGIVHVIVFTNFEGWDIEPEAAERAVAWFDDCLAEHSEIRWTHLYSPRHLLVRHDLDGIFTPYLLRVMNDSNAEIGIHAHLYFDMIRAMRIAPISLPNGDDDSDDCSKKSADGYGVLLTGYQAEDQGSILDAAIDALIFNGFPRPTTFCAGYSATDPSVQTILASRGFTASFAAQPIAPSAPPADNYPKCWHELLNWSGHITPLTIPYRVNAQTILPPPHDSDDYLDLVEVPLNMWVDKLGLYLDGEDVTREEMFDRHWDWAATTGNDTAVAIGVHTELVAGESFDTGVIAEVIKRFLRHVRLRSEEGVAEIRYSTASEVAAHFRENKTIGCVPGLVDPRAGIFAAIWEQDGGPAFVARHNMTPAAFQEAFDQLGPQGFGPTCVSGYVVNGEERFAAIWEQGRPAFDARFGLIPAAFQEAFDLLGPQGFGPTCVSGYVVNGEERFAAIWEQGRPAFDARFGLTPAAFQEAFDQLGPQGFGPTCVSGYVVNGEERFAAIWEQGRPAFDARFGLTPAAFQEAFDQLGPQGFGPTCVSGYVVNGEERFAAIWEQGRPAFDARFGLTAGQYQQTFDQVVGQGFRLRFVNAFERV